MRANSKITVPTSNQRNIQRLLNPRSIILIGGNLALGVRDSSLQFGFEGNIWHINPRNFSEEKFDDALKKLPEIPDSAYIAVPSVQTVSVVRSLAKIGVGGCICYASGFAEMGHEGVELQNKLVEAAGDMALLGPNCFGMIDYRTGLYFWIGEIPERRKGKGIAIVSQSGAIAEFVAMQRREVPIVSIASVGNQAKLTIEHLVGKLLKDGDINVIALVLEGIIDLDRFTAVARKSRDRGVPIIVLKVGNSNAGQEIARWHTGNLVGPSDLYAAYFDDLGILQTESVEQFLETAKLVSIAGRLKSNRIASVTVSGGQAAMLADMAVELGFEHPPLTGQQIHELARILPGYANLVNPLDITSDVMSDKQKVESVCHVLAGETIDVITMSVDAHDKMDAPFSAEVLGMLEALANVVKKSGVVGIVNSQLPETMPGFVQKRAIELGLIPMQGLETMLSAIATASLRAPSDRLNVLPSCAASVTEPQKTQAFSGIYLDEFDSKCLMKKLGVTVPEGFKSDIASLENTALVLGFPVVLKLLSSETLHKTENYRVVINISDEKSLDNAKREIEYHNPGNNLFLIERMVTDVVGELLVSVSYDSKFGNYLTLSSGGVFAGIILESEVLIFPVTRQSLVETLSNLKCFPQLSGYRNRLEGDIEAVISVIESLIAFIDTEPCGSYEVEINPLLVLPRGKGAIVGDVIVKVNSS